MVIVTTVAFLPFKNVTVVNVRVLSESHYGHAKCFRKNASDTGAEDSTEWFSLVSHVAFPRASSSLICFRFRNTSQPSPKRREGLLKVMVEKQRSSQNLEIKEYLQMNTAQKVRKRPMNNNNSYCLLGARKKSCSGRKRVDTVEVELNDFNGLPLSETRTRVNACVCIFAILVDYKIQRRGWDFQFGSHKVYSEHSSRCFEFSEQHPLISDTQSWQLARQRKENFRRVSFTNTFWKKNDLFYLV